MYRNLYKKLSVFFSRFLLTRDLIVLQQIMLSCGSPHEVPLEATEIIHSTFLPRCVVLNHSYFIISWINETHSTAPPNDSLEQVHIYPIFYYVLPLHSMVICCQNCSDLRKKCSKGQIISKGLFGILGFFQKTNEQIRF